MEERNLWIGTESFIKMEMKIDRICLFLERVNKIKILMNYEI